MSVDQNLQPSSMATQDQSLLDRWNNWSENSATTVFIMPAVLVVLTLSIFPLIVSLYLSLSRFKFVQGGFEITFVGFANYKKLLVGSEQRHFLGKMVNPSPLGWLILAIAVGLILYSLWRYSRSADFSKMGLFWRIIVGIGLGAGAWLLTQTLNSEGLPGTLVVTLIFVFCGVSLQYLLGLGLALLTTQNLPGRRFFRVIFLLPMMITPVGIGYMFRMLTDTTKGPFNPIWFAVGLGDFSWAATAWGARIAVIIGDVWQWTPFMFIVLLAALEGQSQDQREAALVDGATGWQIFRHITLPQIIPVSTTVILIRLIEAFKIIDMPQVLTQGGPGTATEPLTLHSFSAWRALDLGGSAAVAYMLLFVVTFVGLSYVNLVRHHLTEAV
ncbi:MAG: sugar ABC transporter permease [Chloroflexota bacterium]